MARHRAIGAAVVFIVVGGLAASLVLFRRSHAVEQEFEVPTDVAPPGPDLPVSVRRSTAQRHGDVFVLAGDVYAQNKGKTAIDALRLEAVLRDDNGSEIERLPAQPVGFYERLGTLPPPYGVQIEFSATTPRRPARCEIVIVEAKPTNGPPGTGAEPWATVRELVWDGGPPPGVVLDVRARGFSIGPEEVIAPQRRTLFDTTVGLQNAGAVPVNGLELSVHFFDEHGQEVGTLPLAPPGRMAILPGDGVLYTRGSGVTPYARSELHAHLSRAPTL